MLCVTRASERVNLESQVASQRDSIRRMESKVSVTARQCEGGLSMLEKYNRMEVEMRNLSRSRDEALAYLDARGEDVRKLKEELQLTREALEAAEQQVGLKSGSVGRLSMGPPEEARSRSIGLHFLSYAYSLPL